VRPGGWKLYRRNLEGLKQGGIVCARARGHSNLADPIAPIIMFDSVNEMRAAHNWENILRADGGAYWSDPERPIRRCRSGDGAARAAIGFPLASFEVSFGTGFCIAAVRAFHNVQINKHQELPEWHKQMNSVNGLLWWISLIDKTRFFLWS